MRPREIRDLIQVRRPHLDRADRVLARCVTIEDLQAEACRRWPRGVRGYVEGGADGEVSLRRNRQAYERFELVPSTLRGVSSVDPSTHLLGVRASLPIALGPTGYTRMMHTNGEPAAARAAGEAGIPYTLSTMATVALEDVATQSRGDLWFQLYVWRDRGLARDLLQRAQASGYRVLMLTVDTPVTGLRARDHRNGFTLPPRLTPGVLADMALHPAWCWSLLRGAPITFANFPPEVSQTSESVMAFAASQFDPSLSWADVDWVREQWPGPVMLKGILSADDAVTARSARVDAVALSNHGGRQLDQTVAPIDVVREVREAVGGELALFVDSGVRHGTDVAIAIALGADGCLIGRPYLYGLGAAGQAGCSAAIRMLGEEFRRAMQLLGVCSVEELRRRGSTLARRGGLPWPDAERVQ